MTTPLLAQLEKFFFSLCWSRTSPACQVESSSLILFSLLMLAAGLLGIFLGRVTLGPIRLKGMRVRLLGIILVLGIALALIPRFGLLAQVLLVAAVAVVAWLLSERPAARSPLPPGTLTYKPGPDEPAYRLHLRLMKDGSGLLVLNAATVMHLNATAAEYAYHMMKGTSPAEAARLVADRYRISRAAALEDFSDFRDRVQTLIHTPDLDPTTFLDFDRVAPHSQDLTAPLRLDCALTYRLPPGADASLAPVKRVDRELDTAEWQSILDKAWAAGIPHITFTGGEPTLREDLPALIAHAEKIGQVTGLLTDGLKLADRQTLQSLLNAGLDHLLFLLEADNPDSWKALEVIMPEDLYTTVHLTVTPANAGKAGEILARLASLQVKSLSLGAAEESLHPALHALHDQAASLGMTLRWDLPVPYSAENPVAHETIEDEIHSGAGKTWLYVEPDGDVLPAQGRAGDVLGNLLRDAWETIYH